MDQISLRELQTYVKKYVDDRNWQTPASDVLIHMVEELGEVARNVLIMKNYGGQHTSDSDHNMHEELADVFYLLLKLANESNVDLAEAFSQKMDDNSKRFPPLAKLD